MIDFTSRLVQWRQPRGILKFIDEEFGVTPDPWQEEALLLFADPSKKRRRLALQACAGPGKTAVLSWAGLWFFVTQGARGEHPKGAALSVSRDNLRDNLWAELAKWRERSGLCRALFDITATALSAKDHPGTWFLSARSFAKTADADRMGATLAGLHSKYPLALIDESGAIHEAVLRAAEQALAVCDFGRILQAGNPISLDGMLYAAATRLRHQWDVVRVTGDPDDPKAWVHAKRLDDGPINWARDQIKTYTRDNPWVMAYVLGQFPPASINQLISLEDVMAAIERRIPAKDYQYVAKRLGVDVARFGDDRTVIFPRQGLVAFKPHILRHMRTTSIAARVASAAIAWERRDKIPVESILIDDTGHWGHGVLDNLVAMGYPAIALQYHARAVDPRYKNIRAENWMKGADWVKQGGQLPSGVDELIGELTTPTYSFVGGQFVLEEKDQIKKRLGRSPDLADALFNTHHLPDAPARILEHLAKNRIGRVALERGDDVDSAGVGRVELEDGRDD